MPILVPRTDIKKMVTLYKHIFQIKKRATKINF
uniref:Uncharacterized protein n=1 Tax=Rhizophora mucronata TaxID=61149 RepID=A0A2P2N8H4_RHIMU